MENRIKLITILKLMYPYNVVTICVSDNEKMILQVGVAIRCLSDDTLNRTVNLLDYKYNIIIQLGEE